MQNQKQPTAARAPNSASTLQVRKQVPEVPCREGPRRRPANQKGGAGKRKTAPGTTGPAAHVSAPVANAYRPCGTEWAPCKPTTIRIQGTKDWCDLERTSRCCTEGRKARRAKEGEGARRGRGAAQPPRVILLTDARASRHAATKRPLKREARV